MTQFKPILQQMTNKQTKTSVKQNKTKSQEFQHLSFLSDQQNPRNSTLVFSMRPIESQEFSTLIFSVRTESQGFSTHIFHQKHRITGVFDTDFLSEQIESQEFRPDCLQHNRQNKTKFRSGLFYLKRQNHRIF